MIRLLPSILFASALLTTALAAPVRAQDPPVSGRGVTLVAQYDPANPPGIVVLPTPGVFGDSVRAIIQRDLEYSDAFKVIKVDGNDPAAFRVAGGFVNYAMFAALGAKYVVEPQIVGAGIHLRVHEVAAANVGPVKDYAIAETGLGRAWRQRIHLISDAIQEYVTGRPGIAATRIAYVRNLSIHIIDSDGYGDTLVPVEDNALSPAWHPSGESLIYSTIGEAPRILSADLRTGKSTVLVPTRENVSYQSPSFTSDGSAFYYVRSSGSTTDVYRASAPDWTSRQVTARVGDNSTPAISPDGNRLAVSTNRIGHNEVYVMNADGTDQEILQPWPDLNRKPNPPNRGEPDWSPDGTKIAFSSEIGASGGRFQIMVMNMRGDRAVKQLTSEGVNEQAGWAPDSRHLVVTSDRSGVRQLWIVDIESGTARQLTRNAGSRLGAWSPRLTPP